MEKCNKISANCRRPNCVHTIEGDEKMNWAISVTFPNGAIETFHSVNRPINWKSWAMQNCPYGTVFTGAHFSISSV